MYVRVLTATALATVAGQAQGQRLDVALRDTLIADPQIAGADAAVRAAEAQVDVDRAARLPTFGVQARAAFQTTDRVFGPRDGQTAGIAADFTLPLYSGGEVQGRIRSSTATLAVGAANREMLVNDRLAATAARYTGLYRDQAIAAARTLQVDSVDTILSATRERARLKELTNADVQQGVARLALSKARLSEARAALTRSGEDLREITGRYFSAVEDVPSPPLPPTLLVDLPEDVATFPAVKLAGARVDVARADLRVARAARLPRLYLTSGLQGANDIGGVTALAQRYRTAMQVAVTLRMPLYQGGEPGARVRQAEQTLANRLEDRRAAENETIAGIRSQYAQLKAAEGSLAALALAVEAGEAALKGVRVQALLGDRSNIDILNAQEEVTQARVQLAQARQRRVALAYAILGTMGRLRIATEAAARAAPPPPPMPPRAQPIAAVKLDRNGLWVWQGSTTWTLAPGRRIDATRLA